MFVLLIKTFAISQRALKKQKAGSLSPFEKGNPAVRNGPAAFRPHLAMGLAKFSTDNYVQKKRPDVDTAYGVLHPGVSVPAP
jgi:hypothetical protein